MSGDRQEAVFRAFLDPGFYPHPVGAVQERETHISRVFLTGRIVYKIKKALNLDFLDYTTLENRRDCCFRETELNRRLSRDVYLDVVTVTEQDGRLAMGGSGRPVEYAVQMRQLPDEMSLMRRLRAQTVGPTDMTAIARTLTRFYADAAGGPDIDRFGSWEAVRENCEENFRQMAGFVGASLDERRFQIVRAATRSHLRLRRDLFEQRIADGRIRDGHGDLRSGHIYLEDGIQIIDCIEFNDRFRYGDVVSDLAFLAMDLDFEGFPDAAQRLVDAYVGGAEDPHAYTLLEFYKCYRAMVRAKVACFRSAELPPEAYAYRKALREAGRFLHLAYRYALHYTRPTLWVVCGLPASGKSTIARQLGRALNIRLLQSDLVRRQLFGKAPKPAPFGEGGYSSEAVALTYGKLLLLAQEALAAGESVILDATFGSPHWRDEVLRLARNQDVQMLFVECRAPDDVLRERLRRRDNGPSVSDAREAHLNPIKARYAPMTDIQGELRIAVDTTAAINENLRRILRHDYGVLAGITAGSTSNRFD